MVKRRKSFDASQADLFSFEVPAAPSREGHLAGLERQVASAVGAILAEAARAGQSRYEVAAGMSELLDTDVTKLMLDAYASEARDGHNISFARFLALVADTGSYRVLDALLRQIGAAVLVGEEVLAAERGHIRSQIEALKQREAQLAKAAPMIVRAKS